jgi:hypothetical protein
MIAKRLSVPILILLSPATQQERLAREWAKTSIGFKSELKRTLEFVAHMNEQQGNHAKAQELFQEARSLDATSR